jgi:hypothetical protein
MPQVTMPDGTVVEMPDQLDPALGARLRAFQSNAAPAVDTRTTIDKISDSVPGTPEAAALSAELGPVTSTPVEADSRDPVIDMWRHGLTTMFKGAAPAAASIASGAAAQGVAGLTAPGLSGGDNDAAAGFIRDFVDENTWRPEAGGSGEQLLEGLGAAFEPFNNIKQVLGETALDVTGSPLVATAFDMLPDVAATVVGAPRATRAAQDLGEAVAPRVRPQEGFAKPDPRDPVAVARSLDIKIRPSDAERIGIDLPGGLAEKFGSPGTTRAMVIDNQRAANRAASEELGVPAGQRLDDTTFENLRTPH